MSINSHLRIARVPAAAVALSAVLALSSCTASSGTAGTAGTAPPQSVKGDPPAAAVAEIGDPCALLSTEDLARIVGGAVKKTAGPAEQFRGRSCDYSYSDSASGRSGTITIVRWQGKSFFSPDSQGLTRIPGVADEAAEDPGIGTVLLRRGEDVVSVQVLPSTNQEKARRIAEAVGGKL